MDETRRGQGPYDHYATPPELAEIVTDAVIEEHMGRGTVTETLALVALRARQESDIARERVSLVHRAYRAAMARAGSNERFAKYVAGLAVAILEEPKLLDILNLADVATWDNLARLGDAQDQRESRDQGDRSRTCSRAKTSSNGPTGPQS
ncbi:hypothetical protein [Actinomadura rupiterrae]|uniref:hypothetical protein n=1 Tax=Actinomadura rupiterrae TaxID=559627 RepID=UPI0020A52214|nr:hypothetical protein [Actinomadura rupiterrae]MCP2342736.1 hypothetical protein [Actinomadura rupiterrae]